MMPLAYGTGIELMAPGCGLNIHIFDEENCIICATAYVYVILKQMV